MQKRIDEGLKLEAQSAKGIGENEVDAAGQGAGSSDSDMGLPPALPPHMPKPSSGFVPSLKIGGLGISTLARDGDGGKTAEQLADMQVLRDQQLASGKKPEDE